MKEKIVNSKERGITLVALVVTIIIMLILAGVALRLALGENGLFKMSEKAVEKYKEAAGNEEEALQDLEQYIKNNTPVEPVAIEKETPCVGYYASKDGKTVDGIIYADQAVGNTNGTQWKDGDGTYTIPVKETGLKEYYVSQESYTTEAFGPKPVLTPINNNGEDRFYIMSLEDFGGKGQNYYWYYSAYGNMSDYSTATSTAFGTGKTNTESMVAKWKLGADGGYGPQDGGSTYKDIWGCFSRGETPEGWFLPSRGELAAFMQELGINSSNYDQFKLSSFYWSSSQGTSNYAWNASMNDGYMSNGNVANVSCVRLSATF